MEITQRTINGICIVEIAGEVDLYHAPELKRLLDTLVASGQHRIVLNLKRLSYMDSTAIGVLIHIMNLLKQHDGRLFLAETAESIEKVLRLTKLIDFFTLWETEAAAVAAID